MKFILHLLLQGAFIFSLTGQQGPDGPVRDPSISDDGRFIAFDTNAKNLIPGSGTSSGNVGFLDRKTRRIFNAQTTGQLRFFGGAAFPQMSGDGRWVAFQSSNSSIPGRISSDIYVSAVLSRTVGIAPATRFKRISRNAQSQAGNGVSNYPTISGDGRYVAYMSRATNLSPNVVNGTHSQIFRHDRDADQDGIFDEDETDATATVLISQIGGVPGDNDSTFPTISRDGQTVLFLTAASNLPGTGTSSARIWRNGAVQRAKGSRRGLTPEGTQTLTPSRIYQADNPSDLGTFFRYRTGGTQALDFGDFPEGNIASSGGRFILTSSALAIAEEDTNSSRDVYLIDRLTTITSLISKGPNGVGNGQSGPNDENSDFLDLSPDGRFAAYVTRATNLGFTNNNGGTFNVIVLDRNTGVLDSVESDITSPVWPPQATVTATEITSSSVRLSWTPASDAGGIAWYLADLNEGKLPRSLAGNEATSTVVSGLKPSTTYAITMIASDHSNNSEEGPATVFTTLPEVNPSTDFAFTGFSCGPNVSVTFRSSPSRTYAVEYSGDLTNWITLKSGVVSEGSLTTEGIAAPATLPEPLFLRVRQE